MSLSGACCGGHCPGILACIISRTKGGLQLSVPGEISRQLDRRPYLPADIPCRRSVSQQSPTRHSAPRTHNFLEIKSETCCQPCSGGSDGFKTNDAWGVPADLIITSPSGPASAVCRCSKRISPHTGRGATFAYRRVRQRVKCIASPCNALPSLFCRTASISDSLY